MAPPQLGRCRRPVYTTATYAWPHTRHRPQACTHASCPHHLGVHTTATYARPPPDTDHRRGLWPPRTHTATVWRNEQRGHTLAANNTLCHRSAANDSCGHRPTVRAFTGRPLTTRACGGVAAARLLRALARRVCPGRARPPRPRRRRRFRHPPQSLQAAEKSARVVEAM
eukprot:366247-Chlamydomonas_euryale.AAC.14